MKRGNEREKLNTNLNDTNRDIFPVEAPAAVIQY